MADRIKEIFGNLDLPRANDSFVDQVLRKSRKLETEEESENIFVYNWFFAFSLVILLFFVSNRFLGSTIEETSPAYEDVVLAFDTDSYMQLSTDVVGEYEEIFN